MKSERIGTKAASANERILFFRSNVLVDATFDRVTGMSAAELRELAGMLPEAKSPAAKFAEPAGVSAQTECAGEFGEVHPGSAGAGCEQDSAAGGVGRLQRTSLRS